MVQNVAGGHQSQLTTYLQIEDWEAVKLLIWTICVSAI